MEKYLIWHIQGGLGKNVASTSLIGDLKRKYSDRRLVMVVSWPEVFLNHRSIDRLLHMGNTPHFYHDYIEGKDTIVFRHEAYNQTAHVNHSQHLIHNEISSSKLLSSFHTVSCFHLWKARHGTGIEDRGISWRASESF